MKLVLALLAICLAVSPVAAFWSTGHMIVAQIAYNELKRIDPTYLAQIENEIKVLKQYSVEDLDTFVESAVWADDNKDIQWTAFNNWHFIDTPVILDEWSGPTSVEPMNATFAIAEMRKTLTNKGTPKFNSQLAISFAWRYLIHLVGDIHQPLHASTLYSSSYPNSDFGGNSFKLTYSQNPDVTNLHALWDACVDQYGSIWAPMNQTEEQTIQSIAASLTQAFPRDALAARLAKKDVQSWVDESYVISKTQVYADIKPNTTPSQDYIDSRRKIINEQLAVAGYRLADLMDTLKHPVGPSVVKDMLAKSQ